MHLSFHLLAMIAAGIFGLLAAIWLFSPSLFLSAWNVEKPNSASLVGRRAGALYSGIAAMLIMARNAEPSAALHALIHGFIVSCLMLAMLGLFEFIKGNANKGILGAVLIEVVLSVLFLQL
jgi:hypothetical protein